MFEKSTEELKHLGAHITTGEIKQQPKLWQETFQIYTEARESVEAFLTQACALGEGRLSVIFTGAGTSDYIGDTVAPYLRRVGDRVRFDFKSIATTDIVSAPREFLDPDQPTLLVSFARSGNSPESLAAVDVVRTYVKQACFLNITCAPEGRLACESADKKDALTILIPHANDAGFAMTGSYTSMVLLATLLFDPASDAQKQAWVETAADMGRDMLGREAEAMQFLLCDYDRVTYLGSGSFGAVAQEAQLKILELAHGLIPTSFDTSMGYRHGPKSFVDGRTLVFVFVSNDPYTRQYDLDILNEIQADGICQKIIAIQQEATDIFEGESFLFKGATALPEAYLALPFIMVGQTVALLNSIRIDNTPDTPSPSGQVSRVVHGVTIHPFTA